MTAEYHHKTWQIRLTAVPPQSPAHQTNGSIYTAQSLAHQTDSSTATKPGMSDCCQYHQSPTHQTKLSSSTTTKRDSSIITKPNSQTNNSTTIEKNTGIYAMPHLSHNLNTRCFGKLVPLGNQLW